MINANHLLRELTQAGYTGFTHKKVADILNGIKGKSTTSDIKAIRKILTKTFSTIDSRLQKLEQ